MVSYATLEDAMVACDANPECSGVYDGDCNGDDYYMCDKDGAYESSSSSCVHVKAKAASTRTAASPMTAAPTAEPEVVPQDGWDTYEVFVVVILAVAVVVFCMVLAFFCMRGRSGTLCAGRPAVVTRLITACGPEPERA